MQTRSSRKRKLDQEKSEPNKHRRTEDDEDDIFTEKFEYFLELPVELQTEIYQRCTLPVKIHFNEVCKGFRNTGGWLRDLIFPKFPLFGFDLKPNILTRFTSLRRLYYNNVTFTENLTPFERYLTSLEELRITVNTPELILPLIRYLTNLRKLEIPDCEWKDEAFFGRLTRLTGLQSLQVRCQSILVEHMTSFKHLTYLDCIMQKYSETPRFDLLTNLKSLKINSYGDIEKSIYQLTQLEVLKLYGADFEEINLLADLKNLTKLEIGTAFSSVVLNLAYKLPQVKSLSLRYLSNVSLDLLNNFPNITKYKIRGLFQLPSNAEQLKILSLGSIDTYTKDNMARLAQLTNLESLSLHGSFVKLLIEQNCNLPTTIRELSLDESNATNENILPYLTKLGNLERVSLSEVTPLFGADIEEEVKNFLKSMPHLQSVCFRGICSSLMSFQKHKSWFHFLRKNKIYTDVVWE